MSENMQPQKPPHVVNRPAVDELARARACLRYIVLQRAIHARYTWRVSVETMSAVRSVFARCEAHRGLSRTRTNTSTLRSAVLVNLVSRSSSSRGGTCVVVIVVVCCLPACGLLVCVHGSVYVAYTMVLCNKFGPYQYALNKQQRRHCAREPCSTHIFIHKKMSNHSSRSPSIYIGLVCSIPTTNL